MKKSLIQVKRRERSRKEGEWTGQRAGRSQAHHRCEDVRMGLYINRGGLLPMQSAIPAA